MGPNVSLLRRTRQPAASRLLQALRDRAPELPMRGGPRGRARQALLPLAGLWLLALEGLVAVLLEPVALLSALALLAAPGLALAPTLPAELGRAGRAVAAPVLGLGAASIAVIVASALGVPVSDTGMRLTLLALVLMGFVAALFAEPAPAAPQRGSQLSLVLGLGAIVTLGLAIQAQVIGGGPVPGTDWGHYLLYPAEIVRQGSLLIDNPLWMLGGEQFRDDPGVASLYAAFLATSESAPVTAAHGIWVFAVLSAGSAFVLANTLWGRMAGLVAAAVVTAVPMNLTILGWHGLSNLWGLCLLPLALTAVGLALRGHRGPRVSWMLALSLMALAAAHRLTLLAALLALGAVAAAVLVRRHELMPMLRFALRSALFALPLGLLLLLDLVPRSSGAGGVQDYEVYLSTKLDLGLVVDELTVPVVVAACLGLVAVAAGLRRDRSLLVVLGLAGGVGVLAYGWVFHMPSVYYRAAYFLPLLAGVAIGVGAAALVARRPRRAPWAPGLVAAVLALALLGSTAAVSDERAPGVRNYYAWASQSGISGLALVAERTRPGEPVVTDRCWSFLAEWLLHRPVLAGLDPADILPGWEARPAGQARTILYGKAGAARRMAARHGVRYAVLNPGCSTDETDAPRLPAIGTPVYESTRLVVLDLAPRGGSL